MKKNLLYTIILFISITSTAFFIANAEDEKDAKNINFFASVFKLLKSDFVDSLDSDILIRRAIDGMVKSVDPHTVFFDSLETRERENVWQGINYAGIGARVSYKDSAVFITGVIEGYGAQENDLRPGDIYVEVDGESLEGKSLDETLKLLRGAPETTVDITVNRPHVGLVQTIITRKEIVTRSIPFYTMLDSVTGYIQVQQFLRGSDIQFVEAVTSLKKNLKLRSIILDLRDNIGGLVEEAVNCVNVFVPKNTIILHVKGKAADYNNITHNEPIDTLMPLVILTNSNSISSGEIFTGAMQDLDRAVIIGQKTFGKGLVQGTRFPGNGTSLYLSAGRYYTPSGRCIQKRDYSKMYINGKEKIFSDTLKKVFYTRNGRKVFDIGGIEPDIETAPPQKSAPLVEALKNASLIFDYATYFRNTKEINVPAEKIIITDVSFFTFIGYLEKRKYPFKMPEEVKMLEFEETTKQNNTSVLFEKKYKALCQQITNSKREMLFQNKDQIKKALQDEIVSRYYYHTGLMENSLQADPEVVYAKRFLANPELYFQMLNKK